MGISDIHFRASLKGLFMVSRIEPESSVSGRSAVFWQAALLSSHIMKLNFKTYMPFSEAVCFWGWKDQSFNCCQEQKNSFIGSELDLG